MSALRASPNGEPPAHRRGDRNPRFLAQSAVLGEEAGPAGRGSTVAIGAIAAALLAWATFIDVDMAMLAPGRVIPAGEPQAIRHPDGGEIAEILVSDGEIVDKGQILIRFDGTEMKERLDEMAEQETKTRLLAAQLRALESGGAPDFSFAPPRFRELVARERLVFASLKDLTRERVQVLRRRVAQAKAKLEEITKRQDELSKDVDVLEEELQLREDLYKKGLTPKEVYAKTQRQVDQALKDLNDLSDAHLATVEDLAVAERELAALENRLKERALDEIAVLTSQLDLLRESKDVLEERVGRLAVEAPAKGVVKGTGNHSLGADVSPGGLVAEIIPFGGEAIVEARVPAAARERVAVGQPASVQVLAPEFARYGGITGALKEISDAVLEDERGRPYHRAVIALDRASVGRGPGLVRLTPGTPVQARVKTGSRTLFAYLWHSVFGG